MVNFSTAGRARIDVDFELLPTVRISEARECMLEVLSHLELVLPEPPPAVILKDVTQTSLKVVARFWVEPSKVFSANFPVREALHEALAAKGALAFWRASVGGALAHRPTGNGAAEGEPNGTEPATPKTPKGGWAFLLRPTVNGAAEGEPNGTGPATPKTPGVKPKEDGLMGGLQGAKDGFNKVGDVGKGALEATLKALGGKALFEQVFASTIDKSDEGLTKAFEKVDVDSSGNISAKEMSAHIASVYGGYPPPNLVSITTNMFKAADTDGDGEISLEEFKTIMRAGPDTAP